MQKGAKLWKFIGKCNCVCKAQSPKFHFLRSFVNSANYCELLKQVKRHKEQTQESSVERSDLTSRKCKASHSSPNRVDPGWELLPHPLHSPDLAPSDFHLFDPLKEFTRGTKFESEHEIKSAVSN